MMHLPVAVTIFLCASAVAVYTDLRRRRIPNLLTYGTCVAVVAALVPQGIATTGLGLLSIVGVILAGSAIYGLGWLGGGDIKLLAAGAAAFGFPSFIHVALYVAVAGALLGAWYALRERRLRSVLEHVALSAVTGTAVQAAATSRRVPYALAICAGATIYAASESVAPWFRLVH